MRIEAIKYRTNKFGYHYFVDFDVLSGNISSGGCIAEIAYKKLLVNKYNFLSDTYCDDDEYYQMAPEERDLYILKKQMEFAGEDRLREALTAAWNKIKPDADKILGLK